MLRFQRIASIFAVSLVGLPCGPWLTGATGVLETPTSSVSRFTATHWSRVQEEKATFRNEQELKKQVAKLSEQFFEIEFTDFGPYYLPEKDAAKALIDLSLRLGDKEQAKELADAIEMSKNAFELSAVRALSAARRWDAAIAAADEVENSATTIFAYSEIIEAMLSVGELEKAKALYEKVPSNADSQFVRKTLQVKLKAATGQQGNALVGFSNTIVGEYLPVNFDARYQRQPWYQAFAELATATTMGEKTKIEKALSACSKIMPKDAIEVRNETSIATSTIAIAQLVAGQSADAKVTLQPWSKIAPEKFVSESPGSMMPLLEVYCLVRAGFWSNQQIKQCLGEDPSVGSVIGKALQDGELQKQFEQLQAEVDDESAFYLQVGWLQRLVR